MRYSPSTNGFYPEDTHYPNLPEDVFSISQELYLSLLLGQGEGKIITPNGDEAPYLSEQPLPTKEQYIATAELEKSKKMAYARESIAPLQDALDINDATVEELSLLKKWKQYSVALNRLDLSSAPDIAWPLEPS